MRFAVMIEAQQGITYAEQLAVARAAEAAGFESFFRSDHYSSFPGPEDNPTTDAWTVLAGLARETTRIGLGVLVSPVTFRQPGQLAKVVTTVDEMAGGRVEVGVGAGWNEVEHARYGLPFPPIGERAERMEEELRILHGLWTEPDGWSFQGRHYRIDDALVRPRPLPAPGRPSAPNGAVRPRIIVGGEGSPRSLRMAARWADEFNVTGSTPDQVRAVYDRLTETCRAAGRDERTVARSSMVGVLVGATEAEVRDREARLLDAIGESTGPAWLEERRGRWIFGTPDAARAKVAEFAAAGVERLMLQNFLPRDMAMIELLGRELVERV